MENNINAILNKALQIESIVKAFPNMAGGKALRFIDGNFAAQGWQGSSFQPWRKRIKETKKTTGKKILIKV